MNRFGLHENIARRLVFVDGLTRCGKSLFSGILSSLKNAEHIQFFNLIEHVVPAVALKGVSVDYARALLRISYNELAYNMRLSRNVNFRPSDQTGVPNHVFPGKYRNRLKRREGTEVVDELRSFKGISPFQTHDLMVNLEVLNQLDIDYRMVELFRHPVENIYSWWRTGWGERFGHDPRAFTITLAYRGQQLPWYCAGYEKKWLSLNSMERCVVVVEDLLKRSVKQYQKSSQKNRVHLVRFERMAENPKEELRKICKFIGTGTNPKTFFYARKARCPRKIDLNERLEKMIEIKKSVSRPVYARLTALSAAYEKNLYGLEGQV